MMRAASYSLDILFARGDAVVPTRRGAAAPLACFVFSPKSPLSGNHVLVLTSAPFPFFLRHCLLLLVYACACRINRPGGTGRITRIHYAAVDDDGINGSAPVVVEYLDVKYTVNGGHDYKLDPDLVEPHPELQELKNTPNDTRGRIRRSRGSSRNTNSAQLIEPATDAENRRPNESQRRPRFERKKTAFPFTAVATAKKDVAVPASKRNAAATITKKKKTKMASPVQRGGKVVRRQALQSIAKAAEWSPTVNSTAAVPCDMDIPREIIIDTAAAAATTPGSGDLNFDDISSPLGLDGVETQPVSTASYDRIVVAAAALSGERRVKLTGRMPPDEGSDNEDDHDIDNGGDDDEDDMECDDGYVLQLQVSPRAAVLPRGRQDSDAGDGTTAPALTSATHLATGRYATTTTTDRRQKQSSSRQPLSLRAPLLDTGDGEADAQPATCAALSLLDVFDHDMKTAHQFIGDVVAVAATNVAPGSAQHDDHQQQQNQEQHHNNHRLQQFRTLLNEVLLSNDGMVEITRVADRIHECAAAATTAAQNAGAAAAAVLPYADAEVSANLALLCAQNKIMRTEGWIYNI